AAQAGEGPLVSPVVRPHKTLQEKEPVECGRAPSSSFPASPPAPDRDPITLEPLGPWTWEFHVPPPLNEGMQLRSNGQVKKMPSVRYNVHSLCKFLLESGDFKEPTTRLCLTIKHVRELDALAARAAIQLSGSLVEAWRGREGGKYKAEKERREMLLGADRCLGELVTEMMEVS
ncbi:unnamed protein product, partial [Chrysoparadoxa australica]